MQIIMELFHAVLVILGLIAICDGEAKKCHRIETPLIELNLPEPRTTDVYLFADDTFVCAGRIVKYDLYAVKLGTVYVGAWMQVNTGGEFRFIGANKLTITKLGQQTHVVPDLEQIVVSKWDALGIIYDEPRNGKRRPAVIPFEISVLDRSYAGSLSRVYSFSSGSSIDSFQVGHEYTFTHRDDTSALPAIHPYIDDTPLPTFCSANSRPISNLELQKNSNLAVYVDFPFNCSGEIDHYKFYAVKPGRFYVSAWIPVMGEENSWKMRSYNEITVTEAGPQTFVVPEGRRMSVLPTDVLGIFYDGPADCVVPYEGKHRSNTTEQEFSRYHSSKLFSPDMRHGLVVSGLKNKGENYMTVAINAYTKMVSLPTRVYQPL